MVTIHIYEGEAGALDRCSGLRVITYTNTSYVALQEVC